MTTPQGPNRREFLAHLGRGAGVLMIGGMIGTLVTQTRRTAGDTASVTLWQVDPQKCIQCGKCATNCVLSQSASRCFHAFVFCGYCDLCTGYFNSDALSLDTAAENQICPTAAIKRKFIEDPYFEFRIERDLCIGCARCVKGCVAYGNGSLHMQIDQDVCVHCNQCSIAAVCPSQAISKVTPEFKYIAPRVKGT